MRIRVNRLTRLVIAAATMFAFSWASASPGNAPKSDEVAPADRPLVKVMSPALFSYVIGAGGESRILIAIEITDVAGAGIVVDDSGEPRFVEPDDNVDAFSRYIVAKGTYTNNVGQSVIQIWSEVPVKQLRTSEEVKVSPPMDVRDLTESDIKKGIELPPESAVDVATFSFKVRDRRGVNSDSRSKENDGSKLYIGFAASLFKPSAPPGKGDHREER